MSEALRSALAGLLFIILVIAVLVDVWQEGALFDKSRHGARMFDEESAILQAEATARDLPLGTVTITLPSEMQEGESYDALAQVSYAPALVGVAWPVSNVTPMAHIMSARLIGDSIALQVDSSDSGVRSIGADGSFEFRWVVTALKATSDPKLQLTLFAHLDSQHEATRVEVFHSRIKCLVVNDWWNALAQWSVSNSLKIPAVICALITIITATLVALRGKAS